MNTAELQGNYFKQRPLEPGENKGRRKINRDDLLQLLGLGKQTGEWRFVRQVALAWLAIYPGDLGINFKLAEAWFMDDRPAPARAILERVVTLDPEYLEAWQLLERIYRPAQDLDWQEALGCLQVLGGEIIGDQKPPIWAAWMRDAHSRICDGRLEGAERSLKHIDNDSQVVELPLFALIRLRLAYAQKDNEKGRYIVDLARKKWPGTLAFELFWAEYNMQQGVKDRAQAVQVLHRCAAQDVTGQVPHRIWGDVFQFSPLWPENLDIFFDLALPAAVAARLGLNQLAAPSYACNDEETPPGLIPNVEVELDQDESGQVPEIKPDERVKTSDEDLKEIEHTFERLSRQVKSPQIGREEWRFPVYVIFSCWSGLLHQYGEQTAQIIKNEMDGLQKSFGKRKGWESVVFLPDEPMSCAQFSTSLISVLDGEHLTDPWKLKLALADLDRELMKQGKMIGAVLIVGGQGVVPFHRLPNPADDSDQEVLSDNPYATLDANYFIPEWPVGRLPGGAGEDAGLIIDQMRNLSKTYRNTSANKNSTGLLMRFRYWFSGRFFRRRVSQAAGYTAAVWRDSSATVFKLIGHEKGMLTSPPQVSQTLNSHRLMDTDLGYFNLHGLSDSSYWYGQRDMTGDEPVSAGPDYPIALRPQDLSKNGRTPKVVFSEACYGAHILSKNEDQAISLRFLSLGTAAVIGSTCISYGSVLSPLIGADLLASLFWRYLRQGLTAGQALMQAKIELAQEMNKRQGYLDGEDQKTLLSFILLGDPMTVYFADGASSKRVIRLKQAPQIQLVSDNDQPTRVAEPELIKVVKQAVDKYLPGLDNAEIHVRSRQAENVSGKMKNAEIQKRTIITISKQVQIAHHIHSEVARVTLNERGKMVKLAVSR